MAKKKLHGAAAAAHARAAKKHKHNPATPKSHGAKHRRRRNPRITFVSALGKVAGGAAAMFGSGVVTTLASVKLSSAMATPTAPAAAAWAYVPSLVVALIGAGVATRSPLVGAGIAAGGAAPFILPVAARILTPAPASTAAGAAGNATVSALRAVSMGSGWRALGAYPRSMASVNMGAVSMGRAYAT